MTLLLLALMVVVFHLSVTTTTTTYANIEGDALYNLRTKLIDPNNVLQSWDPTLVNPCTWFHITCNEDDRVIRVDLGNASLSGELVPQLGQLINLKYLKLHTNGISGPIPSELANLKNLVSLELYMNNLSGSIPDSLGKLTKLRSLRLQVNSISGPIPGELGNLKNLVILWLHMNNLSGSIPDSLGKLTNPRVLLLNNNSLEGQVPPSLTNIPWLQALDLSNNQLSGAVPDTGSFSLFTPIVFNNNPNLCGPVTGRPCPGSAPFSPPPFIFPPPVIDQGNSIPRIGAIAGLLAAGVTSVFAASVVGFVMWRRQKTQKHFHDVPEDPQVNRRKVKRFSLGDLGVDGFSYKSSLGRGLWKPQERFYDVPAEEPLEVHLPQPIRFTLPEILVATDWFSDKNFLDKGGYGKVYKGRLADGSLVAVKRLKRERIPGGELQFQTEVEMISRAVHPNLLRLYGFCITPKEWLLVYPYMSNGSVASCLRERPPSEPPLDWPTRKRIALGAARGLSYLHEHCERKIIHRDVKAANILLNEKFEAIVGDFGLAKLMDYKDTHVTTVVRGTIGHIAPEYLSSGKASEKTDVFGYGIMLLELITGKKAFALALLANDEDLLLLDWVNKHLKEKKLDMIVDPNLKGNYIESEVEELIQVALLNSQDSPTDRPKMSEVVRLLDGDGLTEKWEEWQKEEVVCQEVEISPNWDSY